MTALFNSARLAEICSGVLALMVAVPTELRARPTVGEAQAVSAAFDEVQEAVLAKDTDRLARLVHPSFTMQHALGQIDTRPVWFALVAGGQLARQVAERREIGRDVVVTGDTALIRSLVQMIYPNEKRVSWMRATAVFTRANGRWIQLNQQSSYLYDGPVTTSPPLSDFTGAYNIPGREGFAIEARKGYLDLVWASGAVLPLFPMGEDRFAAGPTSVMAFSRAASGAVEAAVRSGNDGARWWMAQRNR